MASVANIVNAKILIKKTSNPITTRDESEIKGLRIIFLKAYLRIYMEEIEIVDRDSK
jgi:hypothetical protein